METRPDSSRSISESSTGIPSRPGLVKVIPRRPAVTFVVGLIFAIVFAVLVTPSITAERWLTGMGV